MKRIIAFLLSLSLLFTACSNTSENDTNKDTPTNSSNEQTIADEVNYSLYSNVIDAYRQNYNEMQVEPLSDLGLERSRITGLSYANLIDLDKNGVLELILFATPESINNQTSYSYIDANLEYPNFLKIYTIIDNELKFLDSLPFSYFHIDDDTHLGIQLIHNEASTSFFITVMGDNDFLNYSIVDFNGDELITSTEITFEYDESYEVIAFVNGELTDFEKANAEVIALQEMSEKIPISTIFDEQLDTLKEINSLTFDFLADYPVINFENDFSAKNNDLFYYFEDMPVLAQELVIADYYHCLTMNDYDSLLNIFSDEDDVTALKNARNTSLYTTGHILSCLTQLELDEFMMEHASLAHFYYPYIEDLKENKNISIFALNVDEVLNPDKSVGTPQEGGGNYRTYFILSQEKNSQDEWKIEYIDDGKFSSQKNIFEVQYLGTKDDFNNGVSIITKLYEEINAYIDSSTEQVSEIQFFDEDYSSTQTEFYLLRFNSLIDIEKVEIYRVVDNGNDSFTRGELLQEYQDYNTHTLLFSTDSSLDELKNIEIVCTTSIGLEFSYYPMQDVSNYQAQAVYNGYSSSFSEFYQRY